MAANDPLQQAILNRQPTKVASPGTIESVVMKEVPGTPIGMPEFNPISSDALILQALELLNPSERPTVPIGIEDPGFVLGMSNVRSRKDNQFLPIRLRREAGMVTPMEKDRIVVNRKADDYRKKDLKRLAAQLAHEQVHLGGENDENVAYAKQMEVLERLGYKNPDYIEHLKNQMALHGTK